ncbi:hypothetical protein Sjap_004853 [Stephania japonica]|uniref:Uncharacterized protein n=1 Tax=Stephania japonica TaxID=461633 RepID=A0AAP0K3Z3_9MAGN
MLLKLGILLLMMMLVYLTLFNLSSQYILVKKITRKNFNSALIDLRHQVREADFVSVDLEMTGVTTAPWRESLVFDRFDILYLKIKDSVENFAVVQFGICPFCWDASKDSFIAHPYTFYIFPRKELQFDAPAYEFLCQTASMEFLAKYQFDFNACIREGVSYLSRAQEATALSRLNSSNQDDESSNEGWRLKEGGDAELVSFADILFTERMKERISQWRNSLLSNTKGVQSEENSNDLNAKFQTVFFKMRPSIRLDGFTSRQHRLIQQVIRKHFKDLAYVRTVDDKYLKQKLVVYTDSDEDRRLLMKEVKTELCKGAELKVNAAVGFRHVVDLLSSEGKLVVGHNCFLDIAHIYNKFIGPLPSTVEEFATLVHKEFPFIIDTKYLLKADNVIKNLMKRNSTSLSSAFLYLCPQLASIRSSPFLAVQSCVKVEVQVDDMSSSDWNSGAKHEAGYDAIMTGCVFAQVCSHLGVDFKSSPSEGLIQNEKLQKYLNYVYISGRDGAIIDLGTGKEFPEPFDLYDRLRQRNKVVFQNIVVLWGFHSNFKPKDMKECLTKVFGLGSVTSVYYLDETAAFVQFSKEKFVSDFLTVKESLEKANDVISVVHPLAKLLEGGKTRAAPYEAYKEICSSSASQILFAEQAETVNRRQKIREVEFKHKSGSEESCDEMQSTSRHHLPFEELIDVCSTGSQ